MQLSLRTKILLFVVGPIAVLFGAALLWSLEQLKAESETASEAALERRIVELARHTDTRLEMYRLVAENLEFTLATRAAGDIASLRRETYFEVLRQVLRRNEWVPSVLIALNPAARDGALGPIAFAKDGQITTFDIAGEYLDSDWYAEPASTGSDYWSRPFVGIGTDRWLVTFTTPMLDDAQFVGVAGVGFVLEQLASSMGLDAEAASGFVAVDSAGLILIHPDGDRVGRRFDEPAAPGSDPGMAALTKALVSGTPAGLHQVDTSAGPVDFAIADVPTAGWRIGLAVDEAALLADAHKRTRNATLLFAAVFLVGAGLALVFSRAIVAPLERLEQGARKVASGELELVPTEDTGDEVGRLSHALVDMTQQLRSRESELNKLAYVDGLTGLDNRGMFERRLEGLIRLAKRRQHGLVVMFIDLDGFKRVNDSLGHDAGDVVLREVAERLRHGLRGADEVGRFSMVDAPNETVPRVEHGTLSASDPQFARLAGDEFSVAMPDIDGIKGARSAANRLMNTLSQTYRVGEVNVVLTASIGIAIYPDDGTTFDQLIKNADTAMYEAKSAGKNTCAFYNKAMTESVSQRLEIDSRLRVAIENRTLEVHFQPLVPMAPNGLLGVECLLRWTDDKLGTVRPDVFVAVAEESSLINDLGWFVIEVAVAQLCRWREAGVDIDYVAINTAGRQLVPGGFANDLLGRLRAVDLPPTAIELELTERTLMSEESTVETNLRALAENGVRLSVDDFGTGYSSLSYLQRFPLERLKIDKAFVDGLPEHEGNAAITRAVVAMAHCLGMDVVAEGVETRDQAEFLREAAADVAQGWLFSKASPAPALEAWLRNDYAAQRASELGEEVRSA